MSCPAAHTEILRRFTTETLSGGSKGCNIHVCLRDKLFVGKALAVSLDVKRRMRIADERCAISLG